MAQNLAPTLSTASPSIPSSPVHLPLTPQPPTSPHSLLFPCFLTSVQISLTSGYFSFLLCSFFRGLARRRCEPAAAPHPQGKASVSRMGFRWPRLCVCLHMYMCVRVTCRWGARIRAGEYLQAHEFLLCGPGLWGVWVSVGGACSCEWRNVTLVCICVYVSTRASA